VAQFGNEVSGNGGGHGAMVSGHGKDLHDCLSRGSLFYFSSRKGREGV
jgi:hypothetical protein